MNNDIYMLRLGDGSSWGLIATGGTRLWLKKFATIMKLKVDKQDQHSKWPRVFFFSGDSEKDSFKKDFLKNAWRVHDFRALQLWSHRDTRDIIWEIPDEGDHEQEIVRMWTAMYSIYLRVQRSGGLVLHAALIKQDGQGILLAGPGGSGKSTLSRRLPRPWLVLSDDLALIVHVGRERYVAHPIPTWSDYLWRRSQCRWDVERHIPLTAIFFIEQAEYDEVIPIGQGQSAVFINYSSTDVCRPIWRNLDVDEKKAVKKEVFNNSCKLARAVPAYILRISPNGRFWDKMEGVL